MRILVTGGTGVVGRPTVDRLVACGHTVRLFSRRAEHDAAEWAGGVEAYPGDVTEDPSVRGAAEGCDAVLHVVGIVRESPPRVTFKRVNVEGTRGIVREAERAGVGRLLYVSSLGADRGASGYHRSKREAEEIVRGFRGSWLILRPGNVYGPGDEVVSLLLKLVRTLPAIPVFAGDRPFQPIWGEDLGEALARAVEREDLEHRVLELAGRERATLHGLLDRLEALTGRSPRRIPVPERIAEVGAEILERLGVDLPVTRDQVVMLREENVIAGGAPDALADLLGRPATTLDEGLRLLADGLPEKLPGSGVGPLLRKRFWADIRGSRLDAGQLFERVRNGFFALVPEELLKVGAEPGTPRSLEEGATLTLRIPLRGHVQVRVQEIAEPSITCVTLEGHHLAGVIAFRIEEHGESLRFEVRSYTRPAHLLDQLGMAALGERYQKVTWSSMVDAVVRESGGTAPDGVESRESELEPDEAALVEEWVDGLVTRRRREAKDGGGGTFAEEGAPAG
jgi:uncharacterized protein YbjT (DUF2867 family)